MSAAFPLEPPIDWFHGTPDGEAPTGKFSVITAGPDAGRAFGLVADKRTCILNGSNECWTAPMSPTNYEDAMQGDTITAEGVPIKTATIACDLSHVGPRASFGQAVDIMSHTGAAVARVRYMDTPNGPAAFGAIWPGITDRQLRLLQASALSGDWRWRNEYGAYDFCGSIAVNNPGLPIPNRQVLAAGFVQDCACGCDGECVNNPGLPLPSRPVFQPFAMAASLASEHPPVVGSWSPQEETIMTIPNTAGGDIHIHVGPQTAAAPPMTPPKAPAPTPPDAKSPPDEPPNSPSVDDRLAALEARMDAVEQWITEDALSDVDSMAAALPEPQTSAKYSADELKALADKGQVFNQDDLNFPIGDCEDVGNAVQAVGRGNADPAAVKAYIIGVAKKLNCVDSLPDGWVANSTQVGPNS